MRSLASIVPCLLLALAAPVGAQAVFVVDQMGGAGSHFTDLPTAVATVPDGAVLRVRAGTYGLWAIANKGISIVGDDASTVLVQAPLGGSAWGPTLHQPAAQPPLGGLEGVQVPGNVVTFALAAVPQSLAILVLGYDATQIPLEPFAVGTLSVAIAASIGPWVVPANGQLRIAWQIPLGFPQNQDLFGQYVTVEPGTNAIYAAGSFLIFVR